MARSVSDINPNDVFPPRDLPGASENWGRTLEDRVVALEKAALAQQATVGGTNRTIAASTANLADQIKAVVKTESFQVETSGGFGVPTAYATVLAQSISIPGGYTRVDLVTTGVVFVNSDQAAGSFLYGLIVVNGVDGVSSLDGPISSSSDAYGSVALGDTRTLSVAPGQIVLVECKVAVNPGAAWGANVTSRAKLSILALYHN